MIPISLSDDRRRELSSKPSYSRNVSRRIAYAAIFTALAIALSFLENYFPIGLFIPVPGVKIGLANIVTVFAIIMLRVPDTLAIIITRCLVVGLFTGPVSLLFSLTGALMAWIVMTVMSHWTDRFFSVVGISIGGALTHSFGQICVAVFLLKDWNIMFYYLPFLLLISIFTGAITGFAAMPVIKGFSGGRE